MHLLKYVTNNDVSMDDGGIYVIRYDGQNEVYGLQAYGYGGVLQSSVKVPELQNALADIAYFCPRYDFKILH